MQTLMLAQKKKPTMYKHFIPDMTHVQFTLLTVKMCFFKFIFLVTIL